MPRICLICRHYVKYHTGGAEVQVHILAREFQKKGWDVHCIASDIPGREDDEGITLHPFVRDRCKVTATLDDIDADIFYQRGRTFHVDTFARYAKRNGRPFILGFSRDDDCRRFAHAPLVFSRERGNPAKLVWGLLLACRTDITSLRGMRTATTIVCQTRQQREMLKHNLNIAAHVLNNIHPVPNQEEIRKREPPMILWLANLKKWKQPEAFLELAGRCQDVDCRFVLAGKMASSEYRLPVNEALARFNNLEYCEDVDFRESNRLIGSASVFVNTSLSHEGLPNTFIQSWLREVPTISLNVDPDDMIKQERVGYHSGSMDRMEADLRRLISDAELRTEMGRTARAFAVERFGVEKNFGRFYEMAEKLIDGSPASSAATDPDSGIADE